VRGRLRLEQVVESGSGDKAEEQLSRMSKAAGLDKFVGNKFGRAKHARRVQARDDIQDI
jgi:hypothetical protein